MEVTSPMAAEDIKRVVKQWDAATMALIGVLFSLSTFLAHYWFDSIRLDMGVLQSAREKTSIQVATLKTESDLHYQEIIRRLDEMKVWNRSLAEKLDSSITPRQRYPLSP